ncbi:GMC oxidoreductase-domain-containing protein [Mycena alexandri]|uniref:GMC oxidoreductase-domain-containing protein n=1 Tax=Mycena alexandri TaxID=1745969 RepID=A0AAD6T9P4_9AGAR|nr:GMC oxidoreductase-domain-containing protein [Mycena alexandri]
MTAPHTIEAEYDLIFAGGGTAACLTAGRLATAFPALSILVLESGPTTKDKKEHIQAGQYITHLAPTSKTMQFTIAKPSEHLAGRSAIVPSGHCVGGGSSVNFMLYNRPAASDFDAWETDFGNAGWSSKDLIPLLQKAETYEIDPKKSTHGSDGPLKVSFGSEVSQLGKEFVEIGAKFEKNRPESDEGNALDVESINKFFIMPKWISKDGRRSDIPHHYIYNNTSEKLSVFDGTLVNRVIVEDGVAVGVEYQFDNRVHESAPQDIRVVKARKLVVVAAGAMGSPLILERSGLGGKDVLEKAGVAVVAEIPGVGENYQDHAFLCTPYIADPEIKTLNPLWRGDPATWGQALTEWEDGGAGLLGSNYIDGVIKMRPHPEELPELGPDFLEIWNSTLANNADKPLFWLCAAAAMLGDLSTLPNLNFMCSAAFLGYPASRGRLHISASDPLAAPDFEPGFLSNPADVAALRWAYKKGRELNRRLPSFRGVFFAGHPQFPEGSAAAVDETAPVSLDAPKIVFSAEDDKAIDAYLRQVVATTWHSVGTCAMKPFDKGGVVDSKLNVYGVKKLKVVDLSIAPSNVNSNTYSAAIAIGEKAAVIIAEELGGSV